jgi:hypothetical protein
MVQISKARVLTCSIIMVLGALPMLAPAAWASPGSPLATGSGLERGFSGLYNLDFSGAQKYFADWEAAHPDDPVGPVSEAAGLLFSEFNRLGVLEAQFYENDSAFSGRSKPAADPRVKAQFHDAVTRTENLAHRVLTHDPNNRDALFALTLSSGLQADYAALIENRNLRSIHYTKDASTWAQRLLAKCNDCYDVFVATGFSKYIIGSMSAPVRWMLRLGGLPGDKQSGIADLQLTADRGHYLAPFARILLAIAYVREKNKPRALELLAGLRAEFPGNPLYAKEMARLQNAR